MASCMGQQTILETSRSFWTRVQHRGPMPTDAGPCRPMVAVLKVRERAESRGKGEGGQKNGWDGDGGGGGATTQAVDPSFHLLVLACWQNASSVCETKCVACENRERPSHQTPRAVCEKREWRSHLMPVSTERSPLQRFCRLLQAGGTTSPSRRRSQSISGGALQQDQDRLGGGSGVEER